MSDHRSAGLSAFFCFQAQQPEVLGVTSLQLFSVPSPGPSDWHMTPRSGTGPHGDWSWSAVAACECLELSRVEKS